MTLTPQLNDLAGEWRTARLLYPLYSALAREFVIDLPSCNDLETDVVAPPEESIVAARQWFIEVDDRIQVHQLRQFLQTTSLTTDEGLRSLLLHHLKKENRSITDRDKIDFLLVQFFSHSAPSRLEDADVDIEYVSQTLEPVLGAVDATVPDWLTPLEEFISSANRCETLHELLGSGILERGRKLKTECGQDYFLPIAMVAFTRFSFLMRRVFFRLMHQDLNSILDGLRALEQQGVATLDCRRAQFSAEEPTVRLRMICQSWKVMFHAEYSSGQPLRMLVDLRAVVDAALARTAKQTAGKEAAAPKAMAAAATAQFSVKPSDTPEFDVTAAPDWDVDSSTPDGNQ